MDWRQLLASYAAAVDWPAAAFWFEIAQVFPDAIILLSYRDVDSWWQSVQRTLLDAYRRGPNPNDLPGWKLPGWREMITDVLGSPLSPLFLDGAAAKTAFGRHLADVRKRAPANRLVEWRVQDGWAPLCSALGVPMPAEPFPLTNTTAEFRTRAKLDE